MVKIDEILFNSQVIKEEQLNAYFKSVVEASFQELIRRYEKYILPIMFQRGWKVKDYKERTVSCTYGTVTFVRAQLYRDGAYCFPVDKKFGFEPRKRVSKELEYQCIELATVMPEREVCKVIEKMYNVAISPIVVTKALNDAEQVLKEYQDYQESYEDTEEIPKIERPVIYIEADSILLKYQSHRKQERSSKRFEIARLLIHTGSKQVGKNRWELQDKFEISETSPHACFKKAVQMLERHFIIKPETLLITNSDGGKGYAPLSFHSFAKLMGFQRHEHFWDSYHLQKEIKNQLRAFGRDTISEVLDLILRRKKKELQELLESLASQLEGELLESFDSFRKRIIRDFRYTKLASQRGLDSHGIGVMESNHRKLTYRMKHRGMYWTKEGGMTMARLIELKTSGALRNVFFGQWREIYEGYCQADEDYYYHQNKKIEKSYEQIPKKLGLKLVSPRYNERFGKRIN